MEMANGISKKVQKAFNEGNVVVVFPTPRGQDFKFKTYKSRTWAIKAIRQAKADGKILAHRFAFTMERSVCGS